MDEQKKPFNPFYLTVNKNSTTPLYEYDIEVEDTVPPAHAQPEIPISLNEIFMQTNAVARAESRLLNWKKYHSIEDQLIYFMERECLRCNLHPTLLDSLEIVMFTNPGRKHAIQNKLAKLKALGYIGRLHLDYVYKEVQFIERTDIDTADLPLGEEVELIIGKYYSLDEITAAPTGVYWDLKRLYISMEISKYERTNKLEAVTEENYHPSQLEIYLVKCCSWDHVLTYLKTHLGNDAVKQLEETGKLAKFHWTAEEPYREGSWFRGSFRHWHGTQNFLSEKYKAFGMFYLVDFARFLVVPPKYVRRCTPKFLLHDALSTCITILDDDVPQNTEVVDTVYSSILTRGTKAVVKPISKSNDTMICSLISPKLEKNQDVWKMGDELLLDTFKARIKKKIKAELVKFMSKQQDGEELQSMIDALKKTSLEDLRVERTTSAQYCECCIDTEDILWRDSNTVWEF